MIRILFLILCLTTNVFAQSVVQKITFIKDDEFGGKNGYVKIEILASETDTTVNYIIEDTTPDIKFTQELAKREAAKAKGKKIDTTKIISKRIPKRTEKQFRISTRQFNQIVETIKLIPCADHDDKSGCDGTNCTIEFLQGKKYIKYFAWSPTYKTKKRNLVEFVNATKIIVETCGLKYNEMF